MYRSLALSAVLCWGALALLAPDAAAVTITVIGTPGVYGSLNPPSFDGGDGGPAIALADALGPQNRSTCASSSSS